ncbi:hypothetical protein [Nonomuraea zeae]|uniref:Uncharacterized protein n=1 Tax=Nonomuraea zeae TaxID=1642303 RepID=A0A5S4GUR7_9ACTN|nr:hypothetical protein [Nonomuraea zeae]TMR36697.1 hypothetical protein ETD85_09875 [Nonomuraea zeae]
MTDHDVSAAREAPRQTGDARDAARARPPAPPWYAPARGLLFATALILLQGPWNHQASYLIAGVVAVVAFLCVHGVVVRRGGVSAVPGGTIAERVLRRLVPAAAFGAGWLAAVPFGQAEGAFASAVLGGAALWAVAAWEEGRARS